MSHLAWGAWVEMPKTEAGYRTIPSHLAWGAWVEITIKSICWNRWLHVAPRMRCVSWNLFMERLLKSKAVAPRMRCVSWNYLKYSLLRLSRSRTSHEVRELKCQCQRWIVLATMSHLAWGAWVEISTNWLHRHKSCVAPRMRCVSWNWLQEI